LTGAVVGAEALLRWTHSERGPVAAIKFIPVAEDSGLILPISSWVLREACRRAKAWLDQGLAAIPMSINVSGIQLQDATFLYEVLAMLEETKLAPGLLELELTESVLMHLPEYAQSALRYFRDLGVTVSIDDFGTGYSSLICLKRLPIELGPARQPAIRPRRTDSTAMKTYRRLCGVAWDVGLLSAGLSLAPCFRHFSLEPRHTPLRPLQ